MLTTWNRAPALFVLIAMLGFATVAAAAADFVIALPNGYEMTRSRAGEPFIAKRKGRAIVPGPIAAYAVVRNVVTGRVEGKPAKPGKSRNTAPDAKPDAPPAPTYFVLDTVSGEATVGLSEEDWKARLKQLDIAAAPALSPPLFPK